MTASDYTVPDSAVPPGGAMLQQALGNIMQQLRQKQTMRTALQTAYGPDDTQSPVLGGPAASGGGGNATDQESGAPMTQLGGGGVGGATGQVNPPGAWAAGTGVQTSGATGAPDEDPYETPAKKAQALRKTLSLYSDKQSNQFQTMSLAQLEGFVQGKQMKAASALSQAQIREALSRAGMYDAHSQDLLQQGVLRGQEASEDAAEGTAVNNYAGGQPLTLDDLAKYNVLGAMAPSGNKPTLDQLQQMQQTPQTRMNAAMATPGLGGRNVPRLMDSIARMQAMQQRGGATAQTPTGWTSPSGNPFVYMGNDLQRDDPKMPDGATTLPDEQGNPAGTLVRAGGKTFFRPAAAEKAVSPQLLEKFHDQLSSLAQPLETAQDKLASPAAMSRDEITGTKSDIARARSKIKNHIDSYFTTGVLTAPQRDTFYKNYGIAGSPQAAAASGAARVTVRDGKGNAFTVPASQAKQAQSQGYSLVPQ